MNKTNQDFSVGSFGPTDNNTVKVKKELINQITEYDIYFGSFPRKL